MHEGNNVYSIASIIVLGSKIVKSKLVEPIKLLEKDEETINILEKFKKENDHSDCDVVAEEKTILRPPNVKAKGKTNARLTSNLEKRKMKAKKSFKEPPNYQRPVFL
ncbi:protein FAR1-RELATED SEQUENCE 5-like [Forsythia ovata]|uniref:Protein FAR1-RELATED SEQUENCE 5-like n=1 Tax=Forsythia ovata TaxID=205694 RepID=A0ABD1W479_9LAMI